jgi:hypothetical protein
MIEKQLRKRGRKSKKTPFFGKPKFREFTAGQSEELIEEEESLAAIEMNDITPVKQASILIQGQQMDSFYYPQMKNLNSQTDMSYQGLDNMA